jgi:hypothetical protein
MKFCEQCGSASHDKDGFCGGCGAKWAVAVAQGGSEQAGQGQASPYDDLPAQIASIGIPAARPKLVWVAVLLALVLGPIGLFYCTITGMIVMLIVAVILQYFIGSISLLIVLPICVFWAWRAAREMSSVFD